MLLYTFLPHHHELSREVAELRKIDGDASQGGERLALQESKRALAAAALEGTGGGAALTREDLLALLD